MNAKIRSENGHSWIECQYIGDNYAEALGEVNRLFPGHRLPVICKPARISSGNYNS